MVKSLYYRLRELIYAKYSPQKFATGCELVARWVNFEIKDIPKKGYSDGMQNT
jgi:hypothetical protein